MINAIYNTRLSDRLPLVYVFLSGLGFSIQAVIVKILSEDSYHASFHCELSGIVYINITHYNPLHITRHRGERYRPNDNIVVLHHGSGRGIQPIGSIWQHGLYTIDIAATILHGLSGSCYLLCSSAADPYRRCYGSDYAESVYRIRAERSDAKGALVFPRSNMLNYILLWCNSRGKATLLIGRQLSGQRLRPLDRCVILSSLCLLCWLCFRVRENARYISSTALV